MLVHRLDEHPGRGLATIARHVPRLDGVEDGPDGRAGLVVEHSAHRRVDDLVQRGLGKQSLAHRGLVGHHAHAHARVVEGPDRARRLGEELEVVHVDDAGHADVLVYHAVAVEAEQPHLIGRGHRRRGAAVVEKGSLELGDIFTVAPEGPPRRRRSGARRSPVDAPAPVTRRRRRRPWDGRDTVHIVRRACGGMHRVCAACKIAPPPEPVFKRHFASLAHGLALARQFFRDLPQLLRRPLSV